MTKLLAPLIASPQLPQYVQQLQHVLAREHTLRQKFYEEITEQQKAEFINGEVVFHSPVQRRHSVASDFLFKLVSTHVDHHALGWVGHEKIEKYLLRARRFVAAGTFAKGNIASTTIAGFEIPVGAVFHRDANLRALRRLLA